MKRTATILLALAAHAAAQSTINPSASHAYAANAGWADFRPDRPNGVVIGEYVVSGKAYAANFGWIDLGDGSPADGVRYGNSTAADSGVNHDGAGNLSGFAYAANIGWVNFGWASAGDSDRPHFDLTTGAFSGYAWAANAGWFALGGGNLVNDSIICVDSDMDSMGDAWEIEHFGAIDAAGPGTGHDGDGVDDAAEYLAGTDPLDGTSRLQIVQMDHHPNFTRVVLGFSGASPARLYSIETTTDLTGAFTDSGLGKLTGDTATLTVRSFEITANPSRFYRIVPSKPMQP